jgi:ribonuclease-3
MSKSPDTAKAIAVLEAALGHTFQNKDLLAEALTHPSLEGEANYQRLEFLGDRVIGLVAAGILFSSFSSEREGKLSRRYSALVRRETLAEIAEEIDLGQHIRMTSTTIKAGGCTNASILSDVLEALVGAVYLEAGLSNAANFLMPFWDKYLDNLEAPKDPKSGLQEWAQGRRKPLPEYTVEGSEGPDHSPLFTVSVSVDGAGSMTATGASKQEASTKAAEALLQKIQAMKKSKS